MKIKLLAARLVTLILALWCTFWWGHYVGVKSVASSLVSAMRTDASYLEYFAKNGGDKASFEALLKAKHEDIALWSQASEISLPAVISYPIFGPIGAYQLAQVRGQRDQ